MVGLLALFAVLLPESAPGAPLAYLGAAVFDPVSLSVTASIPLHIQAVHPAGTLAYGFVVPPIGGPTPERAVLGALDTRTNTVVATVSLAFEPAGLALDPAGTRLYVTGRVSRTSGAPASAPGSVLVVDPVTLAVLASIELVPAVNTSAPLLHPTAPLLYVFRDATVDVVETTGHRVVASIPVPTSDGRFGSPFIHPSGHFIYANTPSSSLGGPNFAVVIDTRSNALVRTVALGSLDSVGAILPRGPDNALLFTTGIILGPSRGGGAVFDAAAGEKIASLALPGVPITAVTHPEGRAVYFSFLTCLIPSCNLTSAGVAIVDGTTLGVTSQIPAGMRPGDTGLPGQASPPVLSLDPGRGRLYAQGATLQTIDLAIDALVADVFFSAAPSRRGLVEHFVFGPERVEAPGRLIFYTLGSAGGRTAESWGAPGDQPVPADYDGDGRADVAVWRPRHGAVEGVWFIHRSSDGAGTSQQWGAAAFRDLPVPADYDGDGRADVAVWRRVEGPPFPAPTEGIWYIVRSSDGRAISQQWGAFDDVPVPADYDGDRRADIATWRAGTWYIVGSADGAVRIELLGEATDVPVPADYDGDGRADLAAWQPSTGAWSIVSSRDGSVTRRGWGAPGDLPVPADYDGDGRADLAVWRASTGEWWIMGSRDGAVTLRQWGAPGDGPVPADYDGDGLPDLTVYRP